MNYCAHFGVVLSLCAPTYLFRMANGGGQHEDGDGVTNQVSGAEFEMVRDQNARLREELALLKRSQNYTSSSESSDRSVPMKLDRGQERLVHTFVGSIAWQRVKFVPKGDILFNTVAPTLLPAAFLYMGISTVPKKQRYQVSIQNAIREEINVKRSNVKTSVREKYKSK